MYNKLTNRIITVDLLEDNKIDSTFKNIQNKILKCAHKSVPRESFKKRTHYWNDHRQWLKGKRGKARVQAQAHMSPQNIQLLKIKSTKMRNQVIRLKKEY